MSDKILSTLFPELQKQVDDSREVLLFIIKEKSFDELSEGAKVIYETIGPDYVISLFTYGAVMAYGQDVVNDIVSEGNKETVAKMLKLQLEEYKGYSFRKIS